MKSTAVAVAALMMTAAVASTQDLSHVRKIYVFSMGSGLDQYLANHLASKGPFQIVASPEAADAILTDRIGAAFEQKLSQTYPPPAPAKSPKSDKSDSAEKAEKKSDKTDEAAAATDAMANAMATSDLDKPISSFSRGRGNIFLVDRNTKAVLWSTYDRPRNRTSGELDRVAQKIADRLRKAASPPQAK